jgi:hypothetical protein
VSRLGVLRLSAGEQAGRGAVRRHDPRPPEAGLGAQDQGHSRLRYKIQCGPVGLVEQHYSLESVFVRERQIKEWKRVWKIQLIEADNPQWIELYPSLSP